MICKHCQEEIPQPDLTQRQKEELHELKESNELLELTKKASQEYQLGLRGSKAFAEHINPAYDQCQSCNYTPLVGEYAECPSCRAINTNWRVY